MEDGIQLSIHHPLMVRVSIKTYHAIDLQLIAPRIGPPIAIDSSVSPCPPSPIVHTKGETLFVVVGSDSLLLEGREVPIDTKWRA